MVKQRGPVVRRLISANPWINFNPDIFVLLFKSLFGEIFTDSLWGIQSSNCNQIYYIKSFQTWNLISHQFWVILTPESVDKVEIIWRWHWHQRIRFHKSGNLLPKIFFSFFPRFFFRSRKILNKNIISNNHLWKTSASRSWGEWQEVFIISCSVTPQLKHNAYEQPSRFLFSDHTSFRDFRSVLFCRGWFRDGHLLEICLNDYKISKKINIWLE